MPPSAVPARLILYQDNTQRVKVFGLRDDNGAFLNDAVMSATLLDVNRNQVTGCINITMSYVADSNGNYTGTVTAAFEPPVGTDYTMIIEGNEGDSHLHMEIPTEVRVRVN